MTIRRAPSDFVVEEQLDEGFRRALGAAGGHAVYELTKTSMTTPDALRRLERALGVSPGRIEFAGLKDKHAHTVQHVSVAREDLRGEPRRVSGAGWSASPAGWSAEPVAGAAVRGNRFTIVVRGLAKETCSEMDRRAGLLADGDDAVLFVNYFGAQRFGSARHGKGFVGARIVKDDYEGALKLAIATPSRRDAGPTRTFTRMAAEGWGQWDVLTRRLPRIAERRAIEALAAGGSFKDAFAALPAFLQAMYVEAHQSHLWNAVARRLARRIAEESGGVQLRSDDAFGEMVFPPASSVTGRWREMEPPLLARSTKLEPPWGEAARKALAEEGVALEELRVPGLRRPFYGEAARRLFVRASAFSMSAPVPDEVDSPGRLMRTISFELARGSYATVVLRALGQ